MCINQYSSTTTLHKHNNLSVILEVYVQQVQWLANFGPSHRTFARLVCLLDFSFHHFHFFSSTAKSILIFCLPVIVLEVKMAFCLYEVFMRNAGDALGHHLKRYYQSHVGIVNLRKDCYWVHQRVDSIFPATYGRWNMSKYLLNIFVSTIIFLFYIYRSLHHFTTSHTWAALSTAQQTSMWSGNQQQNTQSKCCQWQTSQLPPNWKSTLQWSCPPYSTSVRPEPSTPDMPSSSTSSTVHLLSASHSLSGSDLQHTNLEVCRHSQYLHPSVAIVS